jgi:hypothetical protein
MGKRFRDTEIWGREWFVGLTCAERCAIDYILCRCDAVGVWPPAFSVAERLIGEKVDWEALPSKTNGNIRVLDNGKWYVTDFIVFQYGPLRESCAPHRSYLALLEKHGLRVGEGYPKGTVRDKEKEIEIEKEKEDYAEGVRMTKVEHSALVRQYGEAVVKLAIEKVAAQQIKTGKSYKSPRGAILQWGIRAALEEQAKTKTIDRSPAPKPPCDVPGCGKVCDREHGYMACPEHGRREAVG